MSKTKKLLICSIPVLLLLNAVYGSFLYSRITGKEEMYSIGEACSASRTSCEQTYFKKYLDDISTLKARDRQYFEEVIINEDQIDYSGNCPCPYNSDSRGGSCGGRSSYSKGGNISYCYGTDISDGVIAVKRQIMIDDAQKELDKLVLENIGVYKEKITLYLLIILYSIGFFYIRKKSPGATK